MERVGLPCRVRLPEGTIDAVIVDRYWIEDQGWFAKIELPSDSDVGTMVPTRQVPLDRVERISGVNYDAIRPTWWMRAKRGFIPQHHPPTEQASELQEEL